MAIQDIVGELGSVVAVEANPINVACAPENIRRYRSQRGYGPTLIEAAV